MGRRVRKFGKTGCLFWLVILIAIVVIILYRGKGSFKDAFKGIGKGLRKEVTEVEKPEKPIEKKEDVTVVEKKEAPEEKKIPERSADRGETKDRRNHQAQEDRCNNIFCKD
jgi:FtsZ-interacting cell division protein ZipA